MNKYNKERKQLEEVLKKLKRAIEKEKSKDEYNKTVASRNGETINARGDCVRPRKGQRSMKRETSRCSTIGLVFQQQQREDATKP